MAWLEKLAAKLKLSVTALIVIASIVVVVLIAGGVLLAIFWEDIQYQNNVARLPEGDTVNIRYAFSTGGTENQLSGAVIFPQVFENYSTELACMGENTGCEIALYSDAAAKPPSIMAMVLNEESTYPVTLTGISLEFTGYQPYTAVNLGITPSGGSGESSAIIDRLKRVQSGNEVAFPGAEDWLAAQVKQPEQVIGEKLFLEMGEESLFDPDFLSIQSNEVEFLSLTLPFTADSPAGWYAFEVFFRYETPDGSIYRTAGQEMNVLIPSEVRLFRRLSGEQEGDTSESLYIAYHPFTGEVIAQELDVSPDADYSVIMKTGVSERSQWQPVTYWRYDLETGEPTEIFPPYGMEKAYPSNDGWQQAIITPDYMWAMYDIASDSVTLMNETTRYITPLWSPNDRQLAFRHSTEHRQVGIFNLARNEMTDVPLNISGTLKDIYWVSDTVLMLMVHSGQVTFFYQYHTDTELLEIVNSLAGTKEDRFVVTSQGRIVAINDDYGVTVPGLKHIYPLDYGSIGQESWYCEWVQQEYIAFCISGGDVYLVDQVNESTKKILTSTTLVDVQPLGGGQLALITDKDLIYVFDVLGNEQDSFSIEGISKQYEFGLQFTLLEGN